MVTPAGREQLQRVTDTAGFLGLLILEHPSIDTAYVVNDTRDWTIDGQVYIGLGFRFKLPTETGSEAPRAKLEMDNVGRDLTVELEKLPPGASLQATVRIVSRNDTSQVEAEFTAPLSGVKVTTQTVSAVMGNDMALRAPAVKLRYDLVTAPGLFPG